MEDEGEPLLMSDDVGDHDFGGPDDTFVLQGSRARPAPRVIVMDQEDDRVDPLDAPSDFDNPLPIRGVASLVYHAWHYLKIPVIVLVLLLLASLAISAAAIMNNARAAEKENDINTAYDSAVNSWSTSVRPILSLSAFMVSIRHGETPTAPLLSFEPEIPWPEPTYKSLQFRYSGGLLFDPVSPPQPPFTHVLSQNVSFAARAFTNDTTSVFHALPALNVPLWKVDRVVLSSQAAYDKISACRSGGGYYVAQSHTCFNFRILVDVCAKVSLNAETSRYDLDHSLGGYGCHYPFVSPATYTKWNYDPNSTFSFRQVTATIVSASDPAVSFSQLAEGTQELHHSVVKLNKRARMFGIVAGALTAVTCAYTLLLVLSQRYWRKPIVSKSARGTSRGSHFTPLHVHNAWCWLYLLTAIVCWGLSIGGYKLIDHWSERAAFEWPPILGLQLLIFVQPLAYISLWLFWGALYHSRSIAKPIKLASFVTSSILCFAFCCFVWVFLIRPTATLGVASWNADALSRFLGVFLFILYAPWVPMTALLAYRAHLVPPLVEQQLSVLASALAIGEDDGADLPLGSINSVILPKQLRNPYNLERTRKYSLVFLLTLLLFFPSIILAVMFMPPLWNVPLTYYRSLKSPYSLLWLPIPTASDAAGPWNFKLYLDVVIWYSLLYAMIVYGLLSSQSEFMSRLNRLRFRLPLIGWKTCWGEMLFLGTICALSSWWFWWWFSGYDRIAALPISERLARAMGHMANLFLTLLLFPVARNSFWEKVFGISFEHAIKYHRWAGTLFCVFLTAHSVTWWGNWINLDTFLHNIWTPQNAPNADNWSIFMMHITFIGVLVMVALSFAWFRRRRFEVFFYVHHFFVVVFLTSLIHAWTLWYYMAGSGLLWLIDRFVRFSNGARTFNVMSMQQCWDGHVELKLHLAGSSHFEYKPGQYCFINAPAVSNTQWHPFSISSAPVDEYLSFHIKNMGEGTWTDSLDRLAASGLGENAVVAVDGPYGAPMDALAHHTLILCAGGVGITPMHSLVRHLALYHHAHARKDGEGNGFGGIPLKQVHLFWMVRKKSALEMIRPTLEFILRPENGLSQAFHLHLFLTRERESVMAYDKDEGCLPYTGGRPDLPQELAHIVLQQGQHLSASTTVYACGPPLMVDNVSDACLDLGLDFHEEVFEL